MTQRQTRGGGEPIRTGQTVEIDGWEYQPLRLPPGVSRLTAATQLTVQAEFAGWELSRVRLYADGTRKVWLRRRVTKALQPRLSY